MVIVVCQLGLGTLFAQQVKEIPFELNLNYKPISDEKYTPAPLNATLKINTRQAVSQNGLMFSVVLRNLTASEISVHNILESLSADLFLNDGMSPVALPNTMGEIHFQRGKWRLLSDVFVLDRVLLNGKQEKIDLFKTENITIPANAAFEINLSIREIVKEYRRDVNKIVREKTPKGKYRLVLRCHIFSSSLSEFRFSSVVNSPEVTIFYGQ